MAPFAATVTAAGAEQNSMSKIHSVWGCVRAWLSDAVIDACIARKKEKKVVEDLDLIAENSPTERYLLSAKREFYDVPSGPSATP